MSISFKSQTDFSGGEISPRLSGRTDSKRYQTGLDKCRNWVVTPQGSIVMRSGSKYIGEAASSENVRLIPFERPDSESYVIEISAPVGTEAGKLRVWDKEGRRKVGLVENNLLENGTFTKGSSGVENWDWRRFNIAKQADTVVPFVDDGWLGVYTAKSIVKVDGNATFPQTAKYASGCHITQKILVPAGATEVSIAYKAKQFIPDEDHPVYGGSTAEDVARPVEYTVTVGTTEGGDDLLDVHYYDPETVSPTIGLGEISHDVATTGLAEVWLRITSSTSRTNVSRADSIRGVQISEIKALDATPAETPEEFDHPWTSEDINGIQYASETNKDRVILVSSAQHPQEVVVEPITGDWSFRPVTFLGVPDDWALDNYPRTVEIFQSRAWYGGITSDRARLWASRVGFLDDFTSGTDPDDPIDVVVATRGVIQWLRGQSGTLLLGTDEGEYYVGSSTQAIENGDIHVNPASKHGSAYIQAEPVSDEVMFVSTENRKLRALSFEDSRKNWISADLTFPSEHITWQGIRRIENIKNPNYQMAMLLGDGTWLQCTYHRGTESLAWHAHSTNGVVFSIAATSHSVGSALWQAVKRNEKIFIELIEPIDTYRINMDSWISRIRSQFVEEDGVWYVTGLDHLETLEVFIIEDGANGGLAIVEEGRVPLVNGTLTQEAVVGLLYTATAKLLPLDKGDPSDSVQSAKQRRSSLVIRLVDSDYPKVNGRLPPERGAASFMDHKEPNTTSDAQYTILKWDKGTSIEITQDLPFRTEIVAIFGKTATNRR